MVASHGIPWSVKTFMIIIKKSTTDNYDNIMDMYLKNEQ